MLLLMSSFKSRLNNAIYSVYTHMYNINIYERILAKFVFTRSEKRNNQGRQNEQKLI